MKKIPTNIFQFRIVKNAGKKRVEIKSPTFYQHFINTKTNEGDVGSIEIRLGKPTRSEQQLRYYAVLIGMIAEYNGDTWEETHDALMRLKWGTKEIKIGEQTVEVRKSIANHANFTKIDMMEQIEFTLETCKYLEIKVPTREELGYLPK